MSNYIPNKTKVFDDQNQPWMNEKIENLIIAKDEVSKKQKQSKSILHLQISSAARETRKLDRILKRELLEISISKAIFNLY